MQIFGFYVILFTAKNRLALERHLYQHAGIYKAKEHYNGFMMPLTDCLLLQCQHNVRLYLAEVT